MAEQPLRRRIRIAADHPATAGHFPGNPLVPGVVLLDEVITAVRAWSAAFDAPVYIEQVKFLIPVAFGQSLDLEARFARGAALEFTLWVDGRIATSGRLGVISR